MTPSDATLVTRALEGDRDAFGELVLRHQTAVRRFLRHLAHGDEALADDLAQDTFVQAWHRLGQFRGDAAFATWLLGIAHNHWRNARRKQREVALEAAHLDNLETAPPAARTSDLRQDLTQAMQRLDPDEQTALHLTYQQGLSHSEIATVLGWPLGTVKTHLARSKEKLRTLLAAWNPTT